MASTKLNIAIAVLVAEAQTSVVDKLFAFLGEKIEIDDDMKAYFEEFKGTLKTDQEVEVKASKKGKKEPKLDKDGVPKAKRAPSAYNLYIRDKMAEFKAEGHKGNLMKMAIDAWNAEKPEKPAVPEESSDEKVSSDVEEKKPRAKRGPNKAKKEAVVPTSDAEEKKPKAKRGPNKTKKDAVVVPAAEEPVVEEPAEEESVEEESAAEESADEE
jgi:hypothetical protein